MNIPTASMRTLVASAVLTILTNVAMAQDDSVAMAQDDSVATAKNDHKNRKQPSYTSKVLVSNGVLPANFTDPNLLNGWGVAFNPTGFVWVSSEDAGKSVLYDGNGQPQALVVTVPGPGGEEGHPTGIVFSGGADFVVSNGTTSGPARFIFATENGTIAGWAPNVNATTALQAIDNSADDAAYTGLALSGDGSTHLLYACNFSHSRIDVFDSAFKPVQVAGGFVDDHLPSTYAPFGIQAIGGDIYVTYARQEAPGSDEEEPGPGRGFVNVFDPEGRLIRRIASHGPLNAPWGLALAPASFGRFGGALLVGNLGDGVINAYSPISHKFLGSLRDAEHKRIHIDGLWGMQFGNGVFSQKTTALYWAAGPNDEEDGAYGVVEVVDPN